MQISLRQGVAGRGGLGGHIHHVGLTAIVEVAEGRLHQHPQGWPNPRQLPPHAATACRKAFLPAMYALEADLPLSAPSQQRLLRVGASDDPAATDLQRNLSALAGRDNWLWMGGDEGRSLFRLEGHDNHQHGDPSRVKLADFGLAEGREQGESDLEGLASSRGSPLVGGLPQPPPIRPHQPQGRTALPPDSESAPQRPRARLPAPRWGAGRAPGSDSNRPARPAAMP